MPLDNDSKLNLTFNRWEQNENAQEFKKLKRFSPKIPKIIDEKVSHLKEQFQLNVSHAHEVKSILKNTHYVFIHAQPTESCLGGLIAHKLKNEAVLKAPADTSSLNTLDFRAECPDPSIKEYGRHFISVDANFKSVGNDRSCQLEFLKNNESMETLYDKELTKKRILQAVDGNSEKADEVHAKVQAYVAGKETGILWAIAIPQKTIEDQKNNFCFASKTFQGFHPVMDGEHKKFVIRLKECSKNKNTDKAPVFRILSNALLQCKDARIVCCDPRRYNHFSQKADEIISEIQVQSQAAMV